MRVGHGGQQLLSQLFDRVMADEEENGGGGRSLSALGRANVLATMGRIDQQLLAGASERLQLLHVTLVLQKEMKRK